MSVDEVSKKLHEHLKEKGEVSNREEEVYEALKEHGPCTARELGEWAFPDKEPNYYKPRLTDLKEKHLVVKAGKRKCSVVDHSKNVNTFNLMVEELGPEIAEFDDDQEKEEGEDSSDSKNKVKDGDSTRSEKGVKKLASGNPDDGIADADRIDEEESESEEDDEREAIFSEDDQEQEQDSEEDEEKSEEDDDGLIYSGPDA